MRFDIVTLFPQAILDWVGHGILGRAIERRLIDVEVWDPRTYTEDRHRSVDDRPYGGGPGRVMKFEPLRAALRAARRAAPRARVVYLSPQGRRLDQQAVREFADSDGLILIAGRYEGIDERLIAAEIDEEWSLGDYVLNGGELAALVIVEATARLLPGVLGDDESAREDSFTEDLLDYPHYTRPQTIDGLEVPAVLLSGDHAAIRRWRHKQALGRTYRRRPDLLRGGLDEEAEHLLAEYIREND